jgi:hypothetical protein
MVTLAHHDEGGVTVPFIAVLQILRGIISKKSFDREPDDGESIVRARSQLRPAFPCACRMPRP